MTSETAACSDIAASSSGHGWLAPWRDSAGLRGSADVLTAMIAASLPWSTTAPSILVGLWLLVIAPTINWSDYARRLKQPPFALPFLFLLLALAGTLWSDGAWADRLHAIKPVAKLVIIPPLLYHFSRSRRGAIAFAGFLGSCALLTILSWVVLFHPELKVTATASDGVPVKNYIDQSQEFTFCAFALALPALTFWRERRFAAAIGCLALILLFVTNMLFVASARTALVCMPVLLALFASRHLGRRAALILLVGATAASLLAWSGSPYLRKRITDIGIEYRHGSENISLASTAQRLTYWKTSLAAFAEAPLLGHGTGSIKRQFERAAVGQSGLGAEVVSNPHNQTLNVAVQWGLVGVILLYAMWWRHLLLFTGDGLASWIGLVAVVQNITSSLLNSHLFDFHAGWMYVLAVGVAGGLALRAEDERTDPSRS